MAQISVASKIAILFVRPFRNYLDGYNLIEGMRSQLEKNMRERVDKLMQVLQENSLAKETLFVEQKNFFIRLCMNILDQYEKSYESILPSIIDNLTVEIEKELNAQFTQEELTQIYSILQEPLIQKFITNQKIFAILKACEHKMDYEMQLQFMEMLSKDSYNTEINNTLRSITDDWKANKQNIDFYGDFFENDHRYDEEDFDDNEQDEKK